jgi:hypothetical protein
MLHDHMLELSVQGILRSYVLHLKEKIQEGKAGSPRVQEFSKSMGSSMSESFIERERTHALEMEKLLGLELPLLVREVVISGYPDVRPDAFAPEYGLVKINPQTGETLEATNASFCIIWYQGPGIKVFNDCIFDGIPGEVGAEIAKRHYDEQCRLGIDLRLVYPLYNDDIEQSS